MFDKIQPFITELSNYFDSVSIANDDALQKANRAVIFIDRIIPEYLTSTRIRKHCEIAIMFSVSGEPEIAYQNADEKIANIETALDNSFAYYELSDFQYSYQHNVKRLFVFVRARFYWEETRS